MRLNRFHLDLLLTLVLTALGFLVMGYHPGMEDDGVYLPAIKADLHPAMYPHDAQFFQLQMQATVFDRWMSEFVRWTGIPVAWAELAWQCVALFFILWASLRIARHLFADERARWAGVAMVAAMFTLPVAGTALTIADPNLHPRNLATALILLAVSLILETRRWQAFVLLVVAFLIHPIMAALGISFCCVLTVALLDPAPVWVRAVQDSLAAATPLGWIFASPSSNWREALSSRPYYFLSQWTWYEWLGALAPLFLFWLLRRLALKQEDQRLARFATVVFAYGVFQQIVAVVMLAPGSPERLIPLQPMRYLQLVYLFMALVAGGLLGRYALKGKAVRWAVYMLVLNGSMFLVQWKLLDDGAHLELPWMTSSNPWLQAFDWVRQNTPPDAYFALDPQYLAAPGEGFHGFRALAERSQLVDGIKDTVVVTQVPTLAAAWHEQLMAEAGWGNFQLSDFERLKAQFGVNWVLVSHAQTAGLDCRWHNNVLAACQVP